MKPQNGRNRNSKDLKFKKFPGENVPDPPTGGSAAPFHRTPSDKNLDLPQTVLRHNAGSSRFIYCFLENVLLLNVQKAAAEFCLTLKNSKVSFDLI